MDECYKEYLTSTFVFLNYIVDIDKPNEYARKIINKEYITGSKVAILANILLSIKESVVEKEQNNGINFLSKIFDSALDEATNVIVSNKQDNTYILNSYKDTPLVGYEKAYFVLIYYKLQKLLKVYLHLPLLPFQ